MSDVQQSAVRKFEALTYRESKYIVERSKGATKHAALLAAGFTHGFAHNPQRIESPEVLEAIEAYREELKERVVNVGLVDAVELHEQCTDELRGDFGDLYNPIDPMDSRFNPGYKSGELLPIPLWPEWARKGGVEIIDEPNMVHSDDDGGGSWDQKGRRIKVRMVPGGRQKTRELVAKLKSVNALVDQKGPELHLHLHQEITQKLQGALKRQARLVDVTPKDGGK